jgi:hypothetical protein
MSQLQELAIDAKCLSYLERVFRSGKSLSRLLMERTDFTAGKIYALLGRQISQDEIKDFAVGGIASIKSARRTLAEIATRYLQAPGKEIILEEGLAHAGDPAVKNKEGVFLLGDEIYYVADRQGDAGQIERFLMQPRYAVGLVGIFTAAGPRHVQKTSETELAAFVEATEKIVVGAFDGEGYLVWKRTAARHQLRSEGDRPVAHPG